jgi:hypothetical protein
MCWVAPARSPFRLIGEAFPKWPEDRQHFKNTQVLPSLRHIFAAQPEECSHYRHLAVNLAPREQVQTPSFHGSQEGRI